MLVQIQEMYPEDIRYVYRHFPLSYHDKSILAAYAAEAAGIQGKFFEMSRKIFEGAAEWNEITPEDFTQWVIAKAGELGLDVEKFTSDMNSSEVAQRVEADMQEGQIAGVHGTPTLYINGSLYEGQLGVEIISAIVQLYQLQDRQFSQCPPLVIDTHKQYTATLKTEKGDIVIELFADKAPLAVNSFIFLAQQGWYDNVIFHRVVAGFVAQAGDPLGQGFGGPGYAFDNEISPDLKFDAPGVVGMANSGPENNGSQFFITFDAISDLNGGYTIFGKVIKGMDVVQSLTLRDPSQGGTLPPGDKILSVVIEEK